MSITAGNRGKINSCIESSMACGWRDMAYFSIKKHVILTFFANWSKIVIPNFGGADHLNNLILINSYMLELHLGKNTTFSAQDFSTPAVVLGNAGQGKSVFLLQLALELIRKKESGVIYDPYGDLTNKIREMCESEESKAHVSHLTQEEYLQQAADVTAQGFTLISGRKLTIGARKTRELARQVLKRLYSSLSENQWMIIDEGFDVCDEELFAQYLQAHPKTVALSSTTLAELSEDERKQVFEAVSTWIVYKPRNIDGVWLEEAYPQFSAKDIAAIKQYHYQALVNEELVYDTVPFPLEAV